MGEVFTIFRNSWQVPQLRARIMYVAMMFAVFVLGAHIPIPGVERGVGSNLGRIFGGGGGQDGGGGNLLGMLDMLNGGNLKNFSIFALGIMPYISASIVFQLLVVVFPTLQELQKEGDAGRKKIAQWTRYLTVALCIFQGMGLITMLGGAETFRPSVFSTHPLAGMYYYLLVIMMLTAGTSFLMWIGELITENGIGNGVSLIIFAGILTRIPQGLLLELNKVKSDPDHAVRMILFAALSIAMIAGIVYIHLGQRRIPIQYAKKVVGRKQYGGHKVYLPIRVNNAGVIPIIFAISLLLLPNTVAQFYPPAANIVSMFGPNGPHAWVYYTSYFLLVIVFTYFYTAVTFNPEEVSDNLKKNGGFIPGVRPGRPTREYLERILNRLTFIGAIFLAIVAVLPSIIIPATTQVTQLVLGGTSILIAVGVALDSVQQLEAHLTMQKYERALR
jgi:preprotein translocase subunit SecY